MALEFVKEFLYFIKERKKWWLLPLIIIIILASALIWLAESSVLTYLIYPLV